jgi:hypothetical protein
MIDTTTCPECGELSEVQDRHVIDSTDGPVEHAKVMCIRRHWFLLPVATLVTRRHSESPTPVVREAPPTGEGSAHLCA